MSFAPRCALSRRLAVSLVAVLAFGLVACRGGSSRTAGDDDPANGETEAEGESIDQADIDASPDGDGTSDDESETNSGDGDAEPTEHAEPDDDPANGDAEDAAEAEPDAEPETETQPAVPVASMRFGAFEPWARPIDDYLAVGAAAFPDGFDRGIHDLAPMGDRLWIGYGDATVNMGAHIPIEFRYFSSPDDPAAQGARVDGEGQGAAQPTPQASGEEQIDRYRLLDGALWQAGIDSIDPDELTSRPGIGGNVYRLVGDAWRKRRSIVGGEHVHDVASWMGDVYAVGSGAANRTEFEGGLIFRYLWRSADLGDTFDLVLRVMYPRPGGGDTRFVHLLPTTSALYVFGYRYDYDPPLTRVANVVYDGLTAREPPAESALASLFALQTAPLPDGTGLVVGVPVRENPLVYALWHIDGAGEIARVAGLAGHTVLDVLVLSETNEVLYLTRRGDRYDLAPTRDFAVRVAPAADPGAVTTLVEFSTDAQPQCLAYWRGRLFVGTANGQVWRGADAAPSR